MLKPVTHITITTQTKTLFFDFVHTWEFRDGWTNQTSKGKVVFPKNVYVTDAQTQRRFPLFGENKSINALIQRGDRIKIEAAYDYWERDLTEKRGPLETIVDGWVANVGSGMPVELLIEDNMWKLKQIPMVNKAYSPKTSIETILRDALQGSGFTVNFLTSTTLTYDNALLSSQNETVAQFLAKLRKDAFLYSYFKGNELFVGSLVYVEDGARTRTFRFQDNIISSDLAYNNKKDVVLSAVATNHIQEPTGKTTKDGQAKTRNVRLEVLVTLRNDKVIVKEIKKGDKPVPADEGERRTFTFLQAKSNKELADLAEIELRKYYYTGFSGKFLTFGTPFVEWGDNAQLENDILPEQAGLYKIKAVDYSGGVNGYRQEITLDYKLNV